MSQQIQRWDEVIQRAETILTKGKPLVAAELGVWEGEVSHHLLKNLPSLQLHMIDKWMMYGSLEDDIGKSNGAAHSQEQMDVAFGKAYDTVIPWMDRAQFMGKDIDEAAFELKDRGIVLDFVFLDTERTDVDLKRAMDAMWPLVRPGGFLSGFGYYRPLGRVDVHAGVQSFLAENVGTEVELGKAYTWFFWK